MSIEEKLKKFEARLIAVEDIVFHRMPETPTEKQGKLLADLNPELAEVLDVYDADGETRVKLTKYLYKKDDWAEINEYLKQRGFAWESRGKDSYWHRRNQK